MIPVQLMESAGNFLLCLALVGVWRRRRFAGQIAALYLMGYGALRFGLEFLRGDAERGIFFGGRLSTSQIISMLTFAGGLAIWAIYRRRRLRDESRGSDGQ
jgi:phosphatidylglycerol:prolipoprotein diacylglycerol transferase